MRATTQLQSPAPLSAAAVLGEVHIVGGSASGTAAARLDSSAEQRLGSSLWTLLLGLPPWARAEVTDSSLFPSLFLQRHCLQLLRLAAPVRWPSVGSRTVAAVFPSHSPSAAISASSSPSPAIFFRWSASIAATPSLSRRSFSCCTCRGTDRKCEIPFLCKKLQPRISDLGLQHFSRLPRLHDTAGSLHGAQWSRATHASRHHYN